MIIDCSAEQSPDEQWLSAHEAYSLVCARNGPDHAASSIIKRAHAGLIRARAEYYSFEAPTDQRGTAEHRFSNALLPKDFWWAEGGEGLRQNWQSGDFSTLNKGKYEWKALGVSFDLLGIQAMLAPYQSNSAPITVADTPPHDAARRLRLPADQEILDKMLELHGQGITRDQAAKLIRTLPGFEGVGNEHARRVAQGYLPRGRPKKQAGK